MSAEKPARLLKMRAFYVEIGGEIAGSVNYNAMMKLLRDRLEILYEHATTETTIRQTEHQPGSRTSFPVDAQPPCGAHMRKAVVENALHLAVKESQDPDLFTRASAMRTWVASKWNTRPVCILQAQVRTRTLGRRVPAT